MKRTFCTLILLSLTAAALQAQTVPGRRPYTELEIPVPELIGVHARALGMGGAHIAVAEDASAMTWNPAALVKIRRIELSATYAYTKRKTNTTWYGNSDGWDVTSNHLGGLHFLYPFPTYRGSLVIGFGIDRMKDYNLRYRRSAYNQEGIPGVVFQDRPGYQLDYQDREGKLSAYTAAVGWDVGPRLSLGGSLSYLHGSVYDDQSFYKEDVYGQIPDTLAVEDRYTDDFDLSGWTGTAGFLYRASPRIQFGGVVGTPRYVTTEGFEQIWERDHYEDGSERIAVEEIRIGEDIRFPWWFGFGAAFTDRGITVAGDIRYCDWSGLESVVGGYERNLRRYYNSATAYSIGAEASIPRIPLRVRGGYRYDPNPFNLTYCIDGECFSDFKDPAEVDVAYDQERQFWSAGLGYNFEGLFVVDITFETGSYKRVIDQPDPDLYHEKRSSDQYLVSAGYRF